MSNTIYSKFLSTINIFAPSWPDYAVEALKEDYPDFDPYNNDVQLHFYVETKHNPLPRPVYEYLQIFVDAVIKSGIISGHEVIKACDIQFLISMNEQTYVRVRTYDFESNYFMGYDNE